MRLLLFFTTIVFIFHAQADCLSWFLDQKRNSSESYEDCLIGCSSSSIDMGTFDCTSQCEKFCHNRNCLKIWAQDAHTPCQPMTTNIRTALLNAIEPKNFRNIRYESPPKSDGSTDCSHFVNKMYTNVKLRFSYQSTANFSCINRFRQIERSQLQVGDIVVFQSHIGIYVGGENIISATIGGDGGLAKLDPSDPDFQPSIQKLNIAVFGKPISFLTWECGR